MAVSRARTRATTRQAFTLLTCLLLQSSAYAQPSVDALSQEQAEQARAAFERGVQASEAGDWQRARNEFLRSLATVRKATTLFDLALSELRLNMGHEALATLDELTQIGDPVAHQHLLERVPALRFEAEALITRERVRSLETKLAKQRATSREETRRRRGYWLLGAGAVLGAGSVGAAFWWHERAQAADACKRSDGAVCREQTKIEHELRYAQVTTVVLAVGSAGLLATGGWLLLQRDTKQLTFVPGYLSGRLHLRF